jgi:hypothetical protein
LQSIILSYNQILKKEIVKNVETYFDRNKGIENTIELFNINTFDLLLQNMVTPTVRLEAIDSIGIALEMLSENSNNVATDYDTEIKNTIKTSANKIVITNQTIDKEIRNDISKILQSNPNANKIQLSNLITDNIDSNFLNRYANRSKTIATTTSTLTIGHSQNLIQKKFNAIKRWLSMRDKRVRDGHEKADGQIADELGYFKVGGEELRYPGGGTNGGNNINCRCRLRLEKSEAIVKPIEEVSKPNYTNLGDFDDTRKLREYYNTLNDNEFKIGDAKEKELRKKLEEDLFNAQKEFEKDSIKSNEIYYSEILGNQISYNEEYLKEWKTNQDKQIAAEDKIQADKLAADKLAADAEYQSIIKQEGIGNAAKIKAKEDFDKVRDCLIIIDELLNDIYYML